MCQKNKEFEIFELFTYRYRFTQITVDPQIKTPGGKTYDVIFVGTGKGLFRTKNNWDYIDF